MTLVHDLYSNDSIVGRSLWLGSVHHFVYLRTLSSSEIIGRRLRNERIITSVELGGSGRK